MHSTFKPLWNVIYFSAIFWNKILNKKFASIICAIIYSYMTRKEILYYRLTTCTPKLNLYNKPKTRQKGISSKNFKLHWFQNNLIQVNKSYDFVFLYSCILIALTRKKSLKILWDYLNGTVKIWYSAMRIRISNLVCKGFKM